jgi:chromate transport protein ChrA
LFIQVVGTLLLLGVTFVSLALVTVNGLLGTTLGLLGAAGLLQFTAIALLFLTLTVFLLAVLLLTFFFFLCWVLKKKSTLDDLQIDNTYCVD